MKAKHVMNTDLIRPHIVHAAEDLGILRINETDWSFDLLNKEGVWERWTQEFNRGPVRLTNDDLTNLIFYWRRPENENVIALIKLGQ